VIKHIISGSPAHQSGQLSNGDLILKVDHEEATASNAPEVLDGFHAPGSSIVVSVQKAGTRQVLDGVLVRTASEIVAQGRLVLDLLSSLKVRPYEEQAHLCLNECIIITIVLFAGPANRQRIFGASRGQLPRWGPQHPDGNL
jgi:hypothetical protein